MVWKENQRFIWHTVASSLFFGGSVFASLQAKPPMSLLIMRASELDTLLAKMAMFEDFVGYPYPENYTSRNFKQSNEYSVAL